MPKINVPIFRQPHPDYCVPACIKMVVDYLRQKYGDKEVPNFRISKIAKTIKTDAKNGGQTIIDNVALVNELYAKRSFRIQFIPKYPCDWREVVQENKKGKPVIAWIWITDEHNPAIGTGHSVVITDVDQKNGIVTFIDPAMGEKTQDIVTFISQWENENVDKTLILLEFERRKQKLVLEYINEEQTSER